MISFRQYVESQNIKMPHGNIPGSWFMENNLPMVLRCSCCDMTMASPSVWIDDEGYVYCGDCAGIKEG